MAKSHVIQYFLEVENLYLELVSNLKEFRELAAENKISQEELIQMIGEVERAKENYTRLGYIMFLLNKPQRAHKKITQEEQGWYDALSSASKEAILDESRDVLVKLKELIKSGELNNEE